VREATHSIASRQQACTSSPLAVLSSPIERPPGPHCWMCASQSLAYTREALALGTEGAICGEAAHTDLGEGHDSGGPSCHWCSAQIFLKLETYQI
jgi:hypothetical protein